MTLSWCRRAAVLVVPTLVFWILSSIPTVAQGVLFDSHELLRLRLEAPFRRMISQEGGRHAASLIFADAPNDTIRLEVAPRGKSRLTSHICDFPGLMLFFPEGASEPLFAGQSPVPVVTHCKDRDSYEQLALLEYLAYRVYNIVTDLSLRVRLARIEYFDTERGRPVADRFGFFLENYDALAARSGWERLRVRVVPPDEYDADQRVLFEVFQYFIGNTDWSYTYAPLGETECCHNSVPIGKTSGPVFPVPFDLDQSGLVDAPYATVDPSVPIRSVRERIFRGICDEIHRHNGAIGLFQVHRAEIVALFGDAEFLTEHTRSRVLRYVQEFYAVIGDDRRVQREFLSKCRTP